MLKGNLKYSTSTIAEMSNGIILANFEKNNIVRDKNYQTETQLENSMIENLISQGYERVYIRNGVDLNINLKQQIERLNSVSFTDNEWDRFLKEYINSPNDSVLDKTRKIQENHIYDFTFDNGMLKNIKIIDKKNIFNNKLQVINQFSQEGIHKNRYDVTILVNGLPLVHIELKKRGVNLHQAFDEILRYEKESMYIENSLFKYIQLFVISNGTYTRYFANTTKYNKKSYEFTCEWADAKNNVITDLEDFTKTFFEKKVILELLTKYCIFNAAEELLVMRPYQICATERILWKIKSSYEAKKAGTTAAGGYIWHTTGSGKTLTSFKASKLATELPFIDKVIFVVDRKDLDKQTIEEYKKFQEDSVSGSANTKILKENIEKADNKIVVTTIQKLNEFVKKNPNHEIYSKQVVLIYDECHRSQFGDAQRNIRKAFKKHYQFGFTGTPIFPENALGGEITASIFGAQLHSYVITDAIRDNKVLKFKVDYNNILPKFKNAEIETDDEKISKLEKEMLLHPERITEITKYILEVFDRKTHRNIYFNLKERRMNGFNAMFAVQNIDAAKLYYQEFKKQQAYLPENQRIKVATIFSYAQNEEQKTVGDIADEVLETKALNKTSKEFLDKVINDYNKLFKVNFSTSMNDFYLYYSDVSGKLKSKEIDLLIVVGMFLTGFDAPTLNTLFIDKNLKYHGLIQAYSRTNRILNKVKAFGNIVCFRDLEQATKDAIKTFGDKNSINIILEKSYDEYMYGFKNEKTGKKTIGYIELCNKMKEDFKELDKIETEKDKRKFLKLYGEILKSENILKNFDEFDNFEPIIDERYKQDLKSTYLKIIDEKPKPDEPQICYDDIEFQIELLKTEEINLDYIIALILEKSKEINNVDELKEEIRRVIRSSLGVRAKEELIIEFINHTNLQELKSTEDILEAFYKYANKEKENSIKELIENENLKQESYSFLQKSINKGYADYDGTNLDSIIPPISRRGGKRSVFKFNLLEKIKKLVDTFVGI